MANNDRIVNDGQETKKALRNVRLFWLLVAADVILVIYLVFQMVALLAQ